MQRVDLLDVRGVGPSTKERLGWAGIRTAEDLSRVRDLNVVAEWTGIPPHRIGALVEEAVRATAPRPPHVAIRSMLGATTRLGRTLAEGVRRTLPTLDGRGPT